MNETAGKSPSASHGINVKSGSLRDNVKGGRPKVSVCMITFNHEKYIEQAVESVMTQEADFEYELVVGEDCSTDSTREILRGLKESYPGKIRLNLHSANKGMLRNFEHTLKSCRGEYIAILEGDDYWTSAEKLQIQARFLDEHPECAMCGHHVTEFYEDSDLEPEIMPSHRVSEINPVEQLIRRNFIPTCSSMIRSAALPEFPDWYFQLKMGDWPLHVLVGQRGMIGFIHKTMAAYRVHSAGVWNRTSEIRQLDATLEGYEAVKVHFGAAYARAIDAGIYRCNYRYALEHLKIGETAKARSYAAWCLLHHRPGIGVRPQDLAKLTIRTASPKLYTWLRTRRPPARQVTPKDGALQS